MKPPKHGQLSLLPERWPKLIATADATAVRKNPEQESARPFMVDQARLMFRSLAFRRLLLKSGVSSPVQATTTDANRYAHTIGVATTAKMIAAELDLNEDLAWAIGLGHDIGHVPFAHNGEKALAKIHGLTEDFDHASFGVFILQQIEPELNISYQVQHGILHHSVGENDLTIREQMLPEAAVVRLADKISYIFQDAEDIFGIQGKMRLTERAYRKLKKMLNFFGRTIDQRIDCCIHGLVEESLEAKTISFTSSVAAKNFAELKGEMYGIYYILDELDPYRKHARAIVTKTHERLARLKIFPDPTIPLGLMTDTDVVMFWELKNPSSNDIRQVLQRTTIRHLLARLKQIKKIAWENPDDHFLV